MTVVDAVSSDDVVHAGLGEPCELRDLGLCGSVVDGFDDELVSSLVPLAAFAGGSDETAGELLVDH